MRSENSPTIRKAELSEFDSIYGMGFDVWADGKTLADYLVGCRESPKYARGEWFVTTIGNAPVSSLILYSFSAGVFGIGSIATDLTHRKKGYASLLIEGVVNLLARERSAKHVFLYSDLSPEFYERLHFRRLPAELQKALNTVCMVRFVGESPDRIDDLNPPGYF